MRNNESEEMYLENILVLREKQSEVRAIDVARYAGYSKPSVSRAVGLLKSGGYLVSDELGHLSLTESGVEVAAKIYERHTLLTRYLEMLGVSAETAAEDACKMEHIISDESFLAIKQHVAAMEKMRPAD